VKISSFKILLALLATGCICLSPLHAQRADFLSEANRAFVTTDAPIIAIKNVRIIDGTGGKARPNQMIIIHDGRLAHVGEPVTAPHGADIIDATGLTALPGLVMMHEHLFYRTRVAGETHYNHEPITFPRLYLAHGATTIRTAGAHYPLQDLLVKRSIAEGALIGPDIDVTGPYLDGGESTRRHNLKLNTAEDAKDDVAQWAEQGVTSFKAFSRLKPAVLRAAVAEAHMHGIKVTGHLCATTWNEAIDAGIDNIEHGVITATDFVENKASGECPSEEYEASYIEDLPIQSQEIQSLIDKMIANDVALTATLIRAECWPDRPTAQSLSMLGPQALGEFRSICHEDGTYEEFVQLWIDVTR